MTTEQQLLALAGSDLYTSIATVLIVLYISNRDKGKVFPLHVMEGT
jgi:hypothetical protein